jgi:hypothetical protein
LSIEPSVFATIIEPNESHIATIVATIITAIVTTDYKTFWPANLSASKSIICAI